MTHLTEQDLLEAYYGEAPIPVVEHLQDCGICRREFAAMRELLDGVREAEPEPGRAGLEERVWAAVEPHIREKARRRRQGVFGWVAAAAACIAMLVAGFLHSAQQRNVEVEAQMADHLERAQILLTEVSHTRANTADWQEEIQQARRLLAQNRQLRARQEGRRSPVERQLLEELGFVLAHLATVPEHPTKPDVEHLREQVDGDGLLFKVQVTRAELRPHI